MRSIEFTELDKLKGNYILIDVRSPSEFNTATIPGAINLPIFDDEERSIIGTCYVQESTEKAKLLGVQAISKKLPDIFKLVMQLKKEYHNLIFFCAKQGMRSCSLVALLNSLDINAYTLKGGYKGYRNHIVKDFENVVKQIKFIVISGNTGVGKTLILKKLKELGQDVLNLEEYANHRGSFFGSVGLGKQNSQKQFESLVYESLQTRKKNFVFVEGESKRIGKIIIPESLYEAMKNGIHIKIDASLDVRLDNILSDYSNGSNTEIIDALSLLRKHLSDNTVDFYIDKIVTNQYREVAADLMVKYYDPMYEREKKDYQLKLVNDNVDVTCNKLIDWLDNYSVTVK